MSLAGRLSGARASTATGAAAETRLFDLLDPESQERVVVMRSRYEQMTSLERGAFLQELGLIPRDADEDEARRAARGKRPVYVSERLAAVQARDVGYVTLQQDPVAAEEEPAFQDEEERAARAAERENQVGLPMTDLDLHRMLTDGIYGEAKVRIRPERKSLYEKIGALEGEEEEAEKLQRATDAEKAERELRHRSMMATGANADPVGEAGRYIYRSNAYQFLRLAHSFPGPINTPGSGQGAAAAAADADPALAMPPVNVSGFPIHEEELRRWFTVLDTQGSGYLSFDAFMTFMCSLERDFGVKEEYANLKRDGERLALDNKLGFEAFAYLVMRFARI